MISRSSTIWSIGIRNRDDTPTKYELQIVSLDSPTNQEIVFSYNRSFEVLPDSVSVILIKAHIAEKTETKDHNFEIQIESEKIEYVKFSQNITIRVTE